MALHGAAMLLNQGGYSGYQIDQSMVLDGSSDYLSQTFSTPTSDKIMTWSLWVKNCEPDYGLYGNWAGYNTGVNFGLFGYDGTNNRFRFGQYNPTTVSLISTSFYRDVSSWSHFVVAVDTTQATASDRVKVWHNGIQITDFDTATYPSLNQSMLWNSAINHAFGGAYDSAGGLYYPLDGYLAEVHFIDGTAYEATAFGEFYNGTTAWRPIQPSGLTYGTNGFYLPFTQDTPNLGVDYSGNGNDWTENGSPVQSSDSPTVNYATLNPLDNNGLAVGTLSNGNLDWSGSSVSGYGSSTIAMFNDTGKWYFEGSISSGSRAMLGVYEQRSTAFTDNGVYWRQDGRCYLNNSSFVTNNSYTTSDVVGILFDTDTLEVTYYKNGSAESNTQTLSGDGPWIFHVGKDTTTGTTAWTVDFGQNGFTHSLPTDAKALYAANLPDPTITDPGEHFNAVGYTGDGSTSDRAITGVGFEGDLAWFKNRGAAASHVLIDRLRSGYPSLYPDLTNAELDEDEFVSFDSDGFTIKRNASYDRLNSNTFNFISWNWKAGGAGVPNTDGTISSTVSVNDDAGFSIVSYTGTGSAGTVGHGQSAAPEMIIVKNRDGTEQWIVYHNGTAADAETDYLLLNSSAAVGDSSGAWNDIAPTSTAFSVGGGGFGTNLSGNEMIAYCFRSIPGYSKVFSYTGNGSSDGPFVYLGFKPRWVMFKRSNAAGWWSIFDTEREIYNPINLELYANSTYGENINPNDDWDANSNGIKIRGPNSDFNTSGGNYIGIAFAENPFGGSNIPLGLAQ
jgi:hypothetical protein